MTDFTDLTHTDIDWGQLWKNAREKKGWESKGPKEWDKKSESFASRNRSSKYIDTLLPLLPLTPHTTVLDVGSGPGTLALPMAAKAQSVTAIDFSPNMLALLQSEARRCNIGNIHTIECAWEDDWHAKGVRPHDIAIASRSMNVDDIEAAIEKLNAFSKHFVCITDRISPTPFDPELFKAVGRSFQSGPDYIYTLNILYTMGIHPNVTILELEKTLHFENIDQAIQSYSWMIKDMTEHEEELLKNYLATRAITEDDGRITLHRTPPPRWALIWWCTDSI